MFFFSSLIRCRHTTSNENETTTITSQLKIISYENLIKKNWKVNSTDSVELRTYLKRTILFSIFFHCALWSGCFSSRSIYENQNLITQRWKPYSKRIGYQDIRSIIDNIDKTTPCRVQLANVCIHFGFIHPHSLEMPSCFGWLDLK